MTVWGQEQVHDESCEVLFTVTVAGQEAEVKAVDTQVAEQVSMFE